MTYTMLPVRLREALIGGLLLSCTHLVLGMCGASRTEWPQVSRRRRGRRGRACD